MSFSIKNINNCVNLTNDKIKLLGDKFDIKISKINSNSKIKICNQIHKMANEINPCGLTLYSDTNINLKNIN